MENVIQSKNKNYNSIDLFKFIFSLCVIAIHTHPLEQCDNQTIISIYNSIVGLAVPFFFVSTGYLLGKKSLSKGKECNDAQLIKNHLYKVIKLYIVWSIIYLPLAIVDYIKNGKNIFYNILLYIRGFVFVGEHYNSWILWYLLSTIYSLLFIYILSKNKLSIKKITIICLIITSFGFTLSELVSLTIQYPLIKYVQKLVKITIANGRIFTGFFYISIGMYISNKSKTSSKMTLILFFAAFLFRCFVSDCLGFTTMIETILLFLVIIGMELNNNYKYLRQLSTYNYFSHMWIWSIYYFLVYGEKHYSFDCFLVVSILCIIIGLVHIKIKTAGKSLPVKIY